MRRFLWKILVTAVAVWTLSTLALAQWTNEWASIGVTDNTTSGWVAFRQVGNDWEYRFFLVDSSRMLIMSSPYSLNPQYVYTFSPEERQAGGLIYSLETDLTGDGIVEFYVMAYHGTGTPFRSSFKIVNLVTNVTIFERNAANSSYSYPTVWDPDNDHEYECTFSRWDFPYTGMTYYESWNTGVLAVVNSKAPLPRRTALHQNFPNPFNPSTRFDYEIPRSGHVRIEITNELGQRVRTVVDRPQSSGTYGVGWEGLTESGLPAASGTYYYRLLLDGQPLETRKMTLMK